MSAQLFTGAAARRAARRGDARACCSSVCRRGRLVSAFAVLGMLLLLRDHAGGDEAEIQVVNSSSDVRKTFEISNFDKLFDIT